MSARVPVTLLFVLASIGLPAAQGAFRQSPRDLFERARLIEESNQNLTQAIALYTQAASEAATSNQRDLAATAQLRVGLIHERLGQKAEAERAFKVVVAQYALAVVILQPDEPSSVRLVSTRDGAVRDLVAIRTPDRVQYFGGLSWTPDGKGLLFVKESGGRRELCLADVETGRITPTGLSVPGMTYVRLHPDGTRLAYSAGTRQEEVWVIENFLPARPVGSR